VRGSRRLSPFEKEGRGDFVPQMTAQRTATRFLRAHHFCNLKSLKGFFTRRSFLSR
jgi:hypothetical protein